MHTPHGSDRVRVVGTKVILQSRLAKGWTPRTPKTLTTSEHPGTAVYWDEAYLEVVSAESVPGGIRYVLEPWRDDHVIRQFVSYDAESEARIAADYAVADKQRRNSALTRLAGVVLGHLPSPVQNRLANEMGVSPSRMTLLSCVPVVVALGVCAYIHTGSMLKQEPSPIPVWLWILVALLFVESIFRFLVAMSQSRGMGSVIGTLVYAAYYVTAGSRAKQSLPKPLEEPGDGAFFMIPPEDHVALQDSITMRGPMLSLLTPAEQARLAKNYAFNYREHAFGLAWIILVFSILGVVSSWTQVSQGKPVALLSLLIAATLVVEQVMRLNALRRGPAGSVLAFVVRPFVRDLLK